MKSSISAFRHTVEYCSDCEPANCISQFTLIKTLKDPEGFWRILKDPNCPDESLKVPKGPHVSCAVLSYPDKSWRVLKDPGWSWRILKGPNIYINLNFKGSWHIQNGPDIFWRFLMGPDKIKMFLTDPTGLIRIHEGKFVFIRIPQEANPLGIC